MKEITEAFLLTAAQFSNPLGGVGAREVADANHVCVLHKTLLSKCQYSYLGKSKKKCVAKCHILWGGEGLNPEFITHIFLSSHVSFYFYIV